MHTGGRDPLRARPDDSRHLRLGIARAGQQVGMGPRQARRLPFAQTLPAPAMYRIGRCRKTQIARLREKGD